MLPLVKVEAFLTIEGRQTFREVLDRVRVNNVHGDREAEAVGFINEILEIIGRATTGAGRKVVGDVVAKRAVIRELRNRHDLNHIITKVGDTREYFIGELPIGPDPIFLGRHPHVRFVNARCFDFTRRVILPLKVRLIDDLGAKGLAHFILNKKGSM